MNKTVMFDIDGTLIDASGKPIESNVAKYKAAVAAGHDVGAWSRRGPQYAQATLKKLGLSGKVKEKGSFKPDEAYDNEEDGLGRVTHKVGIPHGVSQHSSGIKAKANGVTYRSIK